MQSTNKYSTITPRPHNPTNNPTHNPTHNPTTYTKTSSRKSHFRIKTQITLDSTSRKQPIQVHLPSIRLRSQIRLEEGLPMMNDDFSSRKCAYTETFVYGRKRVIKCQISFTTKFCYLTLYDTKSDQHYKLRLLAETGKQILHRFQVYKLQFKDHIERDELKRYYLSAPFPPFQRKFYFGVIRPSQEGKGGCGDGERDGDDLYLRNQIKRLDRTQDIYGGLGKEEQ